MLRLIIYYFLLFFSISNCPSQNYCASCTTYEHSNICAKCYNSIFNASKNRCEVPKFNIEYCAEYSSDLSDIKCFRCQYGYYLQNDTTCKPCSANCADCINE